MIDWLCMVESHINFSKINQSYFIKHNIILNIGCLTVNFFFYLGLEV